MLGFFQQKISWVTTLSLGLLFIIFYLGSCATKVSFLKSSVVPAAEGTVKVKKDNNSNYGIKISLENLAQPDRLQPSQNIYVVWMETADNGTMNLGQVNSSSSLLSGKLKGSFETVSTYKPTRIFITGETETGRSYPGDLVVMSTRNF